MRYVVTVRNPDDAVASMRPFIAGHSDAWFEMWQLPKDEIVGPDVETFFEMMAAPMLGAIFGFVARGGSCAATKRAVRALQRPQA